MSISAVFRIVAALVILIGLGVQGTASASAAVPDQSRLQSSVIASGLITNAHGQPDLGGEIYVFALPGQSQLLGKPAGAHIPLTLIGLARANVSGHYAVRALPANVMNSYGRYGYVNLQVIAISGGREASVDYSVAPAGAAWKVEGGANSVPALSFNFATRTATTTPVAASAGSPSGSAGHITLRLGAVAHGLSGLRQRTNFATRSVTPSLSGCYKIPGAIHYNITEHFLTTETQTQIPETVTEGRSSTHTLGVAFNNGSWGADGTLSITHSASTTVSATYTLPHTVYNRVNYRDYTNNCQSGTWREPYGFYDMLTGDGGTTGITWQYNCASHSVGTTWTTGSETDATIGGGVNLSYLTVSAQSGYSASVQLQYTFNHSGEVCGNSSSGPLASSVVEADIY